MSEMLQPNTPAPDFELPDAGGQPVKLSDFRGKNVVLAFYPADWSSVCSNQLSLYQEMIDEIRAKNAEVIGISVDGRESHRAWAEAMNITFPLLCDFWPHGAVAQRYGVFMDQIGISNRALFFIDPDGTIRKTWVGEHPGINPGLNIVLDALDELQAGSDQPAESRMRTTITDDDWSDGPTDAPVTIVEYGDFECPFCERAEAPLREVRQQFADQVRFVWRHFPLTSTHAHAQDAATAAEAAGAQGRFWPMHDLLLANQERLDIDDLRRYADQIGLDRDRFDRDMGERVHLRAIKQDFRNGATDGVNGTPTIFINGVRYDGPRTRDEIAAAVAAALGRPSPRHNVAT